MMAPFATRSTEYRALHTEGFIKLGVDILHKDENRIMLVLPHYYKHPSVDLIPDPDMTLQVLRDTQTAEALTYQAMYRDDVVYPDSNSIEGEDHK